MSFKLLKNNVQAEKELIEKLSINMGSNDPALIRAGESLLVQLKLINSSIPKVLETIAFYSKSGDKDVENSLVNVKYASAEGELSDIAIHKKDEGKLVRALKEESDLTKAVSSSNIGLSITPFIRTSNKVFRNLAFDLSRNLFFRDMRDDLRKVGSPIMLQSYISLSLFATMASFIFALIFGFVLFFLGLSVIFSLMLVFLIPLIVLICFFFFPSSKVRGIEKQINQELPFLTIYLSAIATSGIEPSKIFNILLVSKDYPITAREVRKITNYINFYGADLVTALKFVSKNTPSERFGLLLDGLATTITSGGEITEFLKKHSETLLFDYRLEREKYTHLAETFMNIYISVVIAAPMILMVLLILMSLSGFGNASLNSVTLSIISVFLIAALNLGFLLFLNAKQPKF